MDVLGGQIPTALVDLTSAAPHIKSGAVRALAVTSSARTRIAPDIPTIADAGVPGYSATGWIGLFAPKGVPSSVVKRLNVDVRNALARPEVLKQIRLSQIPSG